MTPRPLPVSSTIGATSDGPHRAATSVPNALPMRLVNASSDPMAITHVATSPPQRKPAMAARRSRRENSSRWEITEEPRQGVEGAQAAPRSTGLVAGPDVEGSSGSAPFPRGT